MMPEWAKKYKVKGTTIRKRNEQSYYLYQVHSERRKDKKYPVLIQDGILGIIYETGIEYTQKKLIDPHELIIKRFSTTSLFKKMDKEHKTKLKELFLVKINNAWFFSKTTKIQKETLEIYKINWKNGVEII